MQTVSHSGLNGKIPGLDYGHVQYILWLTDPNRGFFPLLEEKNLLAGCRQKKSGYFPEISMIF